MTTAVSRGDRIELADVRALLTANAWPSVTVLLATEPAPSMRGADARRLRQLVGDVRSRLQELGGLGADRLVRTLEGLAGEAAQSPTGTGLAIFVSRAVARAVRLPVPVATRVVVDRGFATRDLVRALHRTPPHLVLLLHATSAHLYRGYADTYEPVADRRFPMERRFTVVGAVEAGDDGLEAFCDRVDSALREVRGRHPSPLVLAGSEELLDAFRRRSRNLQRLAGVVTGPASETVGGLYVATRTAMEEYLLSREREAVDLLEEALRTRPESVAAGAAACHEALERTAPAMLVLDEGRVSDGPVEDVIRRGGWVAFTRAGVLDEFGGVALVAGR